MISFEHPKTYCGWLSFGCAILCFASIGFAQEPAAGDTAESESAKTFAERSAKAAEITQAAVAEQAQALEQLRTRQSEALNAIEELRRDSLLAAQRNDEAMSARLKLIEENLARERATDLQEIRNANRSTLTIVICIAGAAFICLLITLLYLSSVLRRLAETAAVFPAAHTLLRGAASDTLASGEGVALPPGDPIKLTAGKLLETIEQLQRKVQELQEGYHLTPGSNGHAENTNLAGQEHEGGPQAAETAEKDALISSLIGKGNTLLNMGDANAALSCYEKALTIDSRCTDALVKKGKALEKLHRMAEAIETYDRALMVDDSLTIAHLGKGGVLNRMERYAEALECYERAMQTQQKTAAAG